MSLSLGPIHHWIFAQIGLCEERSEGVTRALASAQGDSAASAWQAICRRHPGRFRGRAIEGLVDNNIHGSLDGMIATVQAREAALVAWVLAQEDAGARALLDEAYAADGRRWGEQARELLSASDAPGIYDALRELWLEGMPCDVRIESSAESPAQLAWRRLGQPLARYWEGSGVDPRVMAALEESWLAAFVAACDPRYDFERQPSPEGEFRFAIARREAMIRPEEGGS